MQDIKIFIQVFVHTFVCKQFCHFCSGQVTSVFVYFYAENQELVPGSFIFDCSKNFLYWHSTLFVIHTPRTTAGDIASLRQRFCAIS